MSNIIINSFDGNKYTPLLPNANQANFANNSQNAVYATSANNSQQLGGIGSSQYFLKNDSPILSEIGKEIKGGYTQIVGTYQGRFYKASRFNVIPKITVYGYNWCGIIVCDWEGTGGSEELVEGLEIQIGDKYYSIGTVFGTNSSVKLYPISTTDEESNSRFNLSCRLTFGMGLGTWVSENKIHYLWFCPAPLIRKLTPN